MQRQRGVLAPQPLDPALELFRRRRPHGETELAAQQRRTVGRREVLLELARDVRASRRVRGRAVFAVALLRVRVIGVDNALARQGERAVVRDPPGA